MLSFSIASRRSAGASLSAFIFCSASVRAATGRTASSIAVTSVAVTCAASSPPPPIEPPPPAVPWGSRVRCAAALLWPASRAMLSRWRGAGRWWPLVSWCFWCSPLGVTLDFDGGDAGGSALRPGQCIGGRVSKAGGQGTGCVFGCRRVIFGGGCNVECVCALAGVCRHSPSPCVLCRDLSACCYYVGACVRACCALTLCLWVACLFPPGVARVTSFNRMQAD